MEKIGLAAGKSTHTLIAVGGEEVLAQWYIPNSKAGADDLHTHLQLRDTPHIIIAGNKRWATPIAYYLTGKGITIAYVSMKGERGARGRRGNIAQTLSKALMAGAKGGPFFREHQAPTQKEEQLYPSVRIAHEYLDASNNVRGSKHHLLDGLAVLFPECSPAKTTTKRQKDGTVVELPVPLPQPPDIFGKRMRPVLENPNPQLLAGATNVPEKVRTLAQTSLGRHIPDEVRGRETATYRSHLEQYDRDLEVKRAKMAELRQLFASHPAVPEFGGGELITVVLALLAWRPWPHWRELRHFCGLDVSRVDSTGKLRISRVRPHTRQYLYLLATKTKRGKEITGDVKKRVKKIERLLKYLRREYLKAAVVSPS